MGIRIGLDIGVASVGWAVVGDDYTILESASNIFPCADASGNFERREKRQLRRLHRRRKTRVKDFEKLWKKYHLIVPEKSLNNVLELRIHGLQFELSELELFSVLKSALLHRGISYLDDAIDDSALGKNDYEKGLLYNQKELEKDLFPCEIQKSKFDKYGSYRGEIIVDEEGEKVILSNIFTSEAYLKEVKKILQTQTEYHEFLNNGFISEYINILQRKREYYVGPGNELSRTDYGRYTTKIDIDTGKYITEENIFEKLIGKCSVYPEEKRAAAASYTAQEFNILNDLNNLTVNSRKLSEKEKRNIIEQVKTSKTVNMRKIIKQAIGEDIEIMTGARIDKNGKEIFHKFDQYNILRKGFSENGWDIDVCLTTEQLDILGEILTLNTEKAAIINAIKKENLFLDDDKIDVIIKIRKKAPAYFNKWHSFSLKIMNELIPDLYIAPKNQMELLTEMGFFKQKKENFIGKKYIPQDSVIKEIYNPVVVRSVRVTIKILNALIKKYGDPDEIVIEMPRDKNEEEEKKNIIDMQKRNEKELKEIVDKVQKEYGLQITDKDFYHHKGLALKLKLWNEQERKCPYSGKMIKVEDIINNPTLFEVDHIIPRSISFDDSRSNKVLVYHTENQIKGNLTPYMYLTAQNREWDFEAFSAYVRGLNVSRAKKDKLLFMEDITKMEVLQGFINRNINDTRYASRVILNTLQGFFKAKESNTKIKVVRGSFTHQLRKVLDLDKKREESYSHHAVDAMLMCYSQMGLEAYQKIQEEVIDFETGEILDEKKWNLIMNEDSYQEILLNQKNMWKMKQNIIKAEKNVKFWHKRDAKANRGLCNETIRGTKEYDGKIMKINKYDLYNKEHIKNIRKKIEQNKETDFLMFQKDKKTWEGLVYILKQYRDSGTPFSDYEKDTGDYFRKYAKNHNGSKVRFLKYLDGEVGSCIDISHHYGHEKNSKKVILESLKPYRMDVYQNIQDGSYIFVGLKYSDLKFESAKYVINKKAYEQVLIKEKILEDGQKFEDINKNGFEFRLSFFKNEIIKYEKNEEEFVERFLSRTMPNVKNYIETKPIDKPNFEKRHLVGLSKTKNIVKLRTDILGNYYICTQEKFTFDVDIH